MLLQIEAYFRLNTSAREKRVALLVSYNVLIFTLVISYTVRTVIDLANTPVSLDRSFVVNIVHILFR